MSDCSTNAFAEGGIHGAVHWNDGLLSKLSYPRAVNGVERRAEWVEIEGVRFYPEDFELLEVLDNGKRVALEFEGERYVPERTCGIVDAKWCSYGGEGRDTTDFTFSCGHSVTALGEEPPAFCEVCGAKVTDE